ncbi:hypothetical protein [Brevibacillus sp. SIMBA_040]|uniref:hypothetical protein n=1 Tax=unclassified Brevibacillus TaxID=2684853 RepID=UPI00397CAE1C
MSSKKNIRRGKSTLLEYVRQLRYLAEQDSEMQIDQSFVSHFLQLKAGIKKFKKATT